MSASDPTALVRDAAPAPERSLVGGYVAPSRPAPASFDDPVWVILPEYSLDALVGPCEWGALHGNTLPAQNAYVLVAFDDRGHPVVVWWAGAHS